MRGAADFQPKEFERLTPDNLSGRYGVYNGSVYDLEPILKGGEEITGLLGVIRILAEKSGGLAANKPHVLPLDDPGMEHALEPYFWGYMDGSQEAEKIIASQGYINPPVYERGAKLGPIDLSKPIVSQIYSLTSSEYVALSTEYLCTRSPVRFFESPYLEIFSRTKWFVIPIIWIPVALLNVMYAMVMYNLPLGYVIRCLAFGIVVWTFAEYCIHRFIFHLTESCLPDFRFVRLCHFLMHSVHHMLPMDPLRLVMPPLLLIILMSPFYSLGSWLLPAPLFRPLWSGILLGYTAYDLLHYAEHHFVVSGNGVLRYLKAYHMKHHFKYPLLGFGVSSPFWDYVFGTAL